MRPAARSGIPYRCMALCRSVFDRFPATRTRTSWPPQAPKKQQGGNIPGIRSGQNTVSFLARISKRLTLFAAIFLAALATLPTLLSVWQRCCAEAAVRMNADLRDREYQRTNSHSRSQDNAGS